MKRRSILLYLTLFGLAVLTYRNGLHISYYHDDYERLFSHPGKVVFEGFVSANSLDHFYRPIEHAVLAVIQALWGRDTFPLRMLHLLLHAGIAMLVFRILCAWKVHLIPAFSAAVFVIISQLSVYAIASNNTLSQLMATLFSGLSLWFFHGYLIAEKRRSELSKYISSVLFFFLALLSKEASSFLLIAIPFVLVINRKRNKSSCDSMRASALQLVPYAGCFVFYLVLRIRSGSSMPMFSSSAYYSYHFGFNIIKNVVLIAGQTFLPLSSLTVWASLKTHAYQAIVVFALYTTPFLFIVGNGLRKSLRKKIIVIIFVCIVIGWLPVIMLTWLTECYAYSSIIFVALLVGIAADHYWSNIDNESMLIAILATIIFFTSGITNIIGVNEKVCLMKLQGDRADTLLPQVIRIAKGMPQNSWMYFVHPKKTEIAHRRFIMQFFTVLDNGDSVVSFYAQRPDVHLFTGDSLAYRDFSKIHAGIAFTCDIKTLQIYPFKNQKYSRVFQ
jgi:hypothetical protein